MWLSHQRLIVQDTAFEQIDGIIHSVFDSIRKSSGAQRHWDGVRGTVGQRRGSSRARTGTDMEGKGWGPKRALIGQLCGEESYQLIACKT